MRPGPRLWLGALVVIATLWLGACQNSGIDPCDEGGALFNDSFSQESNCGWAEYSRSGASSATGDGVLSLTTSQPGQIWWTNPGRMFDDVIISVETEHVSGPQDNAYGVICRYQSSENFYVFLISSDGYYAIGKYQSGREQVQYLSGEGQYVASSAINQGLARNTLRVSCIGDELTLTVNGELVDSVSDATFVTGDVGLSASSFEPGTLVVSFDNVRVLAP